MSVLPATHPSPFTIVPAQQEPLHIRRLSLGDMGDALRLGVADWNACRSETLVLAFITPVAAILFGAVIAAPNLLPFLFPILAGLALIGPMLTLWFAALSRARETTGTASVETASVAFQSERLATIQTLSLLTVVLFLAWLIVAGAVYSSTLGASGPTSGVNFFTAALTTPAGWSMIFWGYVTGAAFAVVALGIGLVAFPLVLDRDVTALEALQTAVRAMLKNPLVVLAWGALVTVLMILGTLPALLGLSVVLPVLGHSTWHMYRRLIA